MDVPYQPMSEEEIADLSKEAGRSLTPSQAEEYRRRRLIEHEVNKQLKEKENAE